MCTLFVCWPLQAVSLRLFSFIIDEIFVGRRHDRMSGVKSRVDYIGLCQWNWTSFMHDVTESWGKSWLANFDATRSVSKFRRWNLSTLRSSLWHKMSIETPFKGKLSSFIHVAINFRFVGEFIQIKPLLRCQSFEFNELRRNKLTFLFTQGQY